MIKKLITNWEKYVLNLTKDIYRKCTVNLGNKTSLPFLCSTLLDVLTSAAKARKLKYTSIKNK